MQRKALRGNLLLILTAMIWGAAFVAQSAGMEYVGPFTFNAVRNFIGTLAVLPCVWIFTRHKGAGDVKGTLIGGFACGVALFVATAFQQVGLLYTSVGKAGFLTALYIVIVPIFRMVIGKAPSGRVWISVAIAVCGTYLMCVTEGFSINIGDVLMIICAMFFSVHIMIIDHFGQKHDGVRLSCLQFFVSGLLSIPFMFFENPTVGAVCQAWLPILYAGVLSSGVAYTLQILGQKDTNPIVASLIMSTESLFAALAGWLILGQSLSLREFIGSGLLVVAIVLAQIPAKKKNKA